MWYWDSSFKWSLMHILYIPFKASYICSSRLLSLCWPASFFSKLSLISRNVRSFNSCFRAFDSSSNNWSRSKNCSRKKEDKNHFTCSNEYKQIGITINVYLAWWWQKFSISLFSAIMKVKSLHFPMILQYPSCFEINPRTLNVLGLILKWLGQCKCETTINLFCVSIISCPHFVWL